MVFGLRYSAPAASRLVGALRDDQRDLQLLPGQVARGRPRRAAAV